MNLSFVIVIRLRFVFLILFLPLTNYAQGLLKGSMKLPFNQEIQNRNNSTIPESHYLNHDSLEIGDQGNKPICVPYSFAYAYTFLIQKLYKTYSIPNNDINSFSASFMASQTDACDSGLTFDTAVIFVQNKGFCPLEKFPNHPCDQHIEDSIKLIAKNYLINKAYRINKGVNSNEDILEIKKIISLDLPVIIGVQINEEFKALGVNEDEWEFYEIDTSTFLHSMVIIGYDDKTRKFKIANSYGSKWGCDGFFEMSYNKLWQILIYALAIEI